MSIMEFVEVEEVFNEEDYIEEEKVKIKSKLKVGCFILMLIFSPLFLSTGYKCLGEEVNINKVIAIESSGNPTAYNKRSKAIGLMQITPICLRDWNQWNISEKFSPMDLYNPDINVKIGTWYMNKKIPMYLKHYGLEDTIENRLIAYDWGAKNLRDYKLGLKKLPTETKEYIIKYRRS